MASLVIHVRTGVSGVLGEAVVFEFFESESEIECEFKFGIEMSLLGNIIHIYNTSFLSVNSIP